MKQRKRVVFISAILAVVLGACGGGGGGSSSDSGGTVTTVGKIDGFGSVYVNGVKFDTSNTLYSVDDEAGQDDSSLAVGMKVRIEGRVNADGKTGTADSIYYDDDLEGPIDSGSLVVGDGVTTFTILGMGVSADVNATVFDDGASYDGLAEGQELEVSGFFDGTQIVASRIELQNDSDDDYEIKGTVASYDGSQISLTLQNGVVAGPYLISSSAELEIPSDPVGLYVEIKLDNSSGTPEVVHIESDDDDLIDDDDGEVSLRGILAGDQSSGFSVNGVSFEVSPMTRYEPASLEGNLSAGMEVEVEGVMQDGVLIAKEIEAEDGEVEITARVISVQSSDAKNGTITLDLGNSQSLTVETDNSTQFEDSSDFDHDDDGSFNLNELTDSDYVELELGRSGDQYYVISIEREDDDDSTEIEAPLEDYTVNDSVTLLGAIFTVHDGTRYELHDSSTDMETFFSNLEIGRQVEMEDQNSDGAIDEIEMK
ncbi:MAG: hypothetical protein KZQ95_15560 [Candidatus Thiodiazotropha sp. (ex Epidulcina cf. delphinae)]|nr:hypothetical protein [Candidatus Thiodiazotropha sp. (ex Epidulcina cf. delphinae)]